MDADWTDDWDDEVRCSACDAVIPSERLEVFPHTKLCSACQATQEAGQIATDEVEYCSRCGGVMQLQQRRGQGLAGYQLVCGDCGAR